MEHSSILGAIVPPTEMPCSAPSQATTTYVTCAIATAFILLSVLEWRRLGSPLMLVSALGGLLATLNEPMLDVLARVWFARCGSQWTALEMFGRAIPFWIPAAYVCYFGVAPYVLSRLVGLVPDPRHWWATAAVLVALNAGLEIPILREGLYIYYGPQPYVIMGYPMYLAVMNASAVVAEAAVIVRVQHVLTGPRVLLALLFPLLVQATMTGVGMPAYAAVNGGGSMGLVWAGSTITLVIALGALHFVVRSTTDFRLHRPAGPGAADARAREGGSGAACTSSQDLY